VPLNRVPSAADALFTSFTGLTTVDQRDPPVGTYGIYGQNFYKPTQDEILNLIAIMLAGSSCLMARNETGAQLDKGTLVYISGYSAGQTRFLLGKSDPADPAKPHAFVLDANLANAANGLAWPFRDVASLDTSGAGAVGDPIFPAATAGTWGYTALSGSNQLAQELGRVTAKHASTGAVRFFPGARLLRKLGTSYLQDLSVTLAKLDTPAAAAIHNFNFLNFA